MATPFQVQVISNYLRGNRHLDNWSFDVSQLRFGTLDMGGFGQASFVLKRDRNYIENILEGKSGSPTYLGNRIRITDNTGFVCYDGKIFDMTLTLGGNEYSASLANIFSAVRYDYTAKYGKGTSAQYGCGVDHTAKGLFGTRVHYEQVPGTFNQNDARIADMVSRFLADHRRLRPYSPKVLGASGTNISLQISCVGWSEELAVRNAWNASAKLTDTGTTVKDMIRAGAVTTGNKSGNGQNLWHERLTTTADNNVPFQCDFIKQNFKHVDASGVLVARNVAQGQTRLAIIEQLAKFGSSNGRRMLFQVWEDQLNLGQGVPWFYEQPVVRPSDGGYKGYFDSAVESSVLNKNREQIPLWQVRAGRWTVSEDKSAVTYSVKGDIRDDPRAMWIKETEYDAETGTLTMTPPDDFNVEQYIGDLIKGRRYIRN